MVNANLKNFFPQPRSFNRNFDVFFQIHNNLNDFKEHISSKILPSEYGGEVPLKDMIAQFKEEMKKKRESIAALEQMEIDLSKKSKLADLEDELAGVAGSFRKLEVD